MKTKLILVSVLLGLTVSAKESFLSKKHMKPTAKAKTAKTVAAATTVAATASATDSTTATAKQPSALSTDVRFGDQSVGGKYQLPMEALSVVENEKSIDDLIGVRKNFRDRIDRTKGMR